NVIVTGDVDLDDLELPGALGFEDVVVHGKLSLRDLHVKRLSAVRLRIKGGLILDSLRTERGAELEGSAFCGGISATRIAVGTDFTLKSSRICGDGPYKYDDKGPEGTRPTFTLSRGHVGGDLRLMQSTQTCPLSMQAFRTGARILLQNFE